MSYSSGNLKRNGQSQKQPEAQAQACQHQEFFPSETKGLSDSFKLKQSHHNNVLNIKHGECQQAGGLFQSFNSRCRMHCGKRWLREKKPVNIEDIQHLRALKDGGADRSRTCDPHNAIVVLYQLSYDPIRNAKTLRNPAG
jgi:hypothetical protein